MCKPILALGALASGRLGELTETLVRSWLTSVTTAQYTKQWTSDRARQYMLTGNESQADRGSAAGRVIGLVILADLVEQRDPDINFRAMVRTHNGKLIKRMVEGRAVFQECLGPALSREEDLNALNKIRHMIFRARFDGTGDLPQKPPRGEHQRNHT